MATRSRPERARPAAAQPGRRDRPAPAARSAPWGLDPTGALAAGADRETRIQLFDDVNRRAGNAAAGALVRGATLQLAPSDDPYDEAGDAAKPEDAAKPGVAGQAGEAGQAGADGKDAAPAGYTLTNARFTSLARLQDIANGGKPLSNKDPKPVVKAAQTALLDVGYSLLRYKDDGSFGGETATAISQFRADRGITDGEGLDAVAMQALDKAAPPPGTQTQHYLDYSRLFADGRLDVTLAIGYDEDQTHYKDLASARDWFARMKLAKSGGGEPAKPEGGAAGAPTEGGTGEGEAPAPDPDAQTRKGISVPETWTGTRSVTYPDKDGARITKDIVVSITLVPPGTGGKAAFAKGLNESEITLYSGHARMGIGPDFDPDKSPYENFVIGVGSALHKAGRVQAASQVAQHHYVVDKQNDLEAMKDKNVWDPEKYRVWFFNACSSIAYMDELRGGLLPEKMDRHNLDLFGTNQTIPIAAGLEPVFANLEGVLNAETMEQIVDRMQTSTLEAFKKAVAAANISEARKQAALKEYEGQLFMREGAGDNPVAATQ